MITGMVPFCGYTILIAGSICVAPQFSYWDFFAIYIPFSKGYSYAFDIIVYVTFGYFSRGKLGDR
jgi:hypothetical protein